eukprot:CAMPEP_0172851272 /NCGR_PEP_ID=MMETSP1075-20121228/51543_1 /TAXON_ID=2916 /ORGANISM="Ceratium fusus, Strain PA161109" /LENGTH=156 /DNA_ID=CAMNT_0013697281 /DNA_START=212 /DNA_END=683 /DNA_ORIENTATION=+
MREPTLAPIPAAALLVPHAKILLVKEVCGAELLLAVCKRAFHIIALTTGKGLAEPRLAQVGHLLQLVASMCKRAIFAKLANALQMVHAELRLSQLPMKARSSCVVLLFNGSDCDGDPRLVDGGYTFFVPADIALSFDCRTAPRMSERLIAPMVAVE